ncbi:hypothetical protein PC9H_008579 [Pleurotus ostreatus]|uniref:Chromo domain-containing protein n=1 Tax=Pleurotus ostreatus TaxID=5322 RepID=A0A8H7DQP9_PLEOS|nr:uncharacterized protein PC9H_008579 [Pleurotus ostreatus]KAF7426212.1 hypothetical protein PC9H_008579 [Pleurotus ostreatus]
MEHTSERRYPSNTKLEHECSSTAGLAEQMLCLLKPLLLAHQEVVLSRLDQVEQSVQEVSMDLEDLRTGFKIFFDEYRVEWDGDPEATRGQGYPKPPVHNDIPCDEYVKASLGPVNWANTTNMLPHASPRYNSVSTADSDAHEHEEELRAPKPLHNAMPDSSYALKMSPESPNRPLHHFPLPTPSSSSPLISRTRELEHQSPPGFLRSPPDSSSTTPQPIISEEDQQPPNDYAPLDPVNRVETINPLPNANPRSASASTVASNGGEQGEGPCTSKALCDGAVHANAPIRELKESVELPHRFPLLTPSSPSPSIGRTRGNESPTDFSRSAPDANGSSMPCSEPQAIQVASEEEQQLSTPTSATENIAAAISDPPTNTLRLPHARTPLAVQPVTPPASNHPTSSSPNTGDEDRMFSRFLNNEAMMCTASAQEDLSNSTTPGAGPSTFLEGTHTTSMMVVPQPEPAARDGSVGSSEYDALAAESLLFAREHSHPDLDAQSPPIYHDDKHEHHEHLRTNGAQQPCIGLMSMKAEIQNCMSMMGTVDPTHTSTLSPLSSLSSLSPSPEPRMLTSTSTHVSAPIQSTQPKLISKLNANVSNRRKSAAATRIRKRKHQPKEGENEGVASTSTSETGTEPPTKRFKSSGSGVGELDESARSAIQTISWPEKSEADNGFLRKVIQCDTCKHWYHYGCVGITRKDDGRLRARAVFVCPVCEVHPYRRPKKGKDSSICARHDCNRQQTESEYHVSRIIGRRNINADASGTAYRWLIKWSGYPVTKSTWETDDAISDPELLIKRFYQAAKKEKGVEFDLSVKEPILLKEAVKVGWW